MNVRTIWRITLWGLLALSCARICPAQVVLHLQAVPGNTPPGDSIYVTGNFNDWQPDDPDFRLQRDGKGGWRIRLESLQAPLAFKFTRGSWENVEGDSLGNAIVNRTLEGWPADDSLVMKLAVRSWEDLPPRQARATVRIVVEDIPANTPPDAPIYIVGNFNSWHPADPNFRLQALNDSTWWVTVPVYGEQLEYKFTRGNWETVEGRSNGRARYNRVFAPGPGASTALVQTGIETWEDLSGNPINPFTFVWLLAAVVGILLIVAINSLQNNNTDANRVLSLLVLIISLALLGRVAVYDREIFQAYPKLLLVPDLIYFLYAPVFLLYIRTLLLAGPTRKKSKIWRHFLPFGLHVVAYLPLFLMGNARFISLNVDLSLQPFFILAGGLALVYNLGYWWYLRRQVRTFQRDSGDNFAFEQNLGYLYTVIGLQGICLLIWLLTYLLGGIDLLVEADLSRLTDRGTDVLFLAFSLTVFCLGYFAMREPEIFQLPAPAAIAEVPKVAAVTPESPDAGLAQEKQLLRQLMQNEKPWRHPKLSLAELAEMCGTSLHDLSRVINLGFGMNFNDFINSYRVEAFKEKVLQPEYQQHTFLAIALMVGFNSKTAFNRAFKKLTGTTPREFSRTKS